MKLLDDIAKQFGASKAEFKGEVEYEGTVVSFNVKDPYKPDKSKITDPVALAIANRYQETLKITERRFVQCIDTQNVYSDIMEAIVEFYDEHAPLKNPRQSRLYKWLRSMDNRYNHPASEGFILLYRYISSKDFSDNDQQNALAILDLMREKYEESND